jgi:putative transposase
VGSVAPSYKGFRYPAEIISHSVWLYHRFPLSFREVEEMMLKRGVVVPRNRPAVVCEVRPDLRQRAAAAPGTPRGQVAPRRGIHQDQRSASLPVAGRGPARRGVGHPGSVPTQRQGGQAVLPPATQGSALRAAGGGDRQAGQLRCRAPRDHVVCRAPKVEVLEQSGGKLTSAHPSAGTGHERFTSPGHAQRFLSAFSGISPHFRPRRHRLRADEYRREMTVRFATWNEVAGLTGAV